MKRTIVLVISFIAVLQLGAQKDSKVIASINKDQITVGEFKKVYEKNLSAIDNEEGRDVAKNLELYINYKLKVQQAYSIKLDTLSSYKREIESYRRQLTAPYLQDKASFDSLVQEAYYRTKNEVRASHILIKLPRDFRPEDTVRAFYAITEARKRVAQGEAFDQVAKEVSQDPSAKTNGGDLGFFNAFKMLYAFENEAYKINNGEISKPFRTRYGYHILKRTDTRTSLGEVEIAHILITDTTSVGEGKINDVFSKLNKGEDFGLLAKEYSNDTNSKVKGGKLPKFGTGRMVKPFETAAFSIKNEGDFTPPFRTRYGWHIAKLIKKYPVRSFEEAREEIERKVKRNSRVKLSDQVVLNRLKSTYDIQEITSAKDIFEREDMRSIPKDSLKAVILKINDREIKQQEFVTYTLNRRHLPILTLFENFKNQQILDYFKDNLRNTNEEFASTLKEYEDGLLLFELMQAKVWNRSADTTALKKYFDQHASKYNSETLSEVKGKVMNDYQDFLEKKWIDELRSQNFVKINQKVLKKLIAFYRRKS